ncbi:hypothetical protein ACFXKF_32975 [Streptomyces scopuliridis]|uniref:hypothetical protein n=1 Tax=Streptomyces scopuliridis TaxID=452529 RepID=UPI0036C31418
MADALVPLLRRASPEHAGGYGGGYQVNLQDEEAVGLGGVELIRAALRRAARTLDWRVQTIGWVGTQHGTIVAVYDRREVPEPYAKAVADDMNARMRAALHRVWGEESQPPEERRTVAFQTQEFRAAIAASTA